jgi:hypothetical protein
VSSVPCAWRAAAQARKPACRLRDGNSPLRQWLVRSPQNTERHHTHTQRCLSNDVPLSPCPVSCDLLRGNLCRFRSVAVACPAAADTNAKADGWRHRETKHVGRGERRGEARGGTGGTEKAASFHCARSAARATGRGMHAPRHHIGQRAARRGADDDTPCLCSLRTALLLVFFAARCNSASCSLCPLAMQQQRRRAAGTGAAARRAKRKEADREWNCSPCRFQDACCVLQAAVS